MSELSVDVFEQDQGTEVNDTDDLAEYLNWMNERIEDFADEEELKHFNEFEGSASPPICTKDDLTEALKWSVYGGQDYTSTSYIEFTNRGGMRTKRVFIDVDTGEIEWNEEDLEKS